MNLQTNSPQISVGRRIAIFTFLSIFSLTTALRAQQSSSSTSSPNTNRPQPAPAPTSSSFMGHLVLEGGAGGAMSAGLQTGQYVHAGFTGMGGAGYKLNKRLSVFLEGNYYYNSMPSALLQTIQQSSGHYNTFTISANPMFHMFQGQKYGVYAIGGGGFSHIATGFSKPIGSTINCNIYSGLGYAYLTNFCNGKITGSSYSSSQPLFDFGLGMDVRLFPNHREILFVESRYVHIMTPSNQLPGPGIGLVPISAGVRW